MDLCINYKIAFPKIKYLQEKLQPCLPMKFINKCGYILIRHSCQPSIGQRYGMKSRLLLQIYNHCLCRWWKKFLSPKAFLHFGRENQLLVNTGLPQAHYSLTLKPGLDTPKYGNPPGSVNEYPAIIIAFPSSIHN